MSTENNLAKKRRSQKNIAFAFCFFTATSYAIVVPFVILAFIVVKGIGVISWEFISEMPKNGMTEGGFFLLLLEHFGFGFSMIFAFPVGVLAAIYMNEYVKDGWPKKNN
jgi:phosphate transport system permease protein